MTNAHAHRQHRNQRLRVEVADIIGSMQDGEILKTAEVAAH